MAYQKPPSVVIDNDDGTSHIVIPNQRPTTQHLGPELRFLIDTPTKRLVDMLRWYLKIDVCKEHINLYLQSSRNKDHEHLHLHRVLMDCPAHLYVDHISSDTTDNRLCNLQVVTHSKNHQNRKRDKGYNLDKRNGQWLVRITVNKERLCVGYFLTEQEAIEARRQAEIKYWGQARTKLEDLFG